MLPGGPPGNHPFIAQLVGNEGGNLKGTDTWPAKGLSWCGVSRRLRADVTRGAPFSGGKGGQGDTLKKCFLVVIEAPEKAGEGIAVRIPAKADDREVLAFQGRRAGFLPGAETLNQTTSERAGGSSPAVGLGFRS